MNEVKINIDGQSYYGGRSLRVRNDEDAARFRYLQNLPRELAQAYFWNYESRRQRAEAIDRDMKAAEQMGAA